ncbi:MAG: carboxypeptidase-like regulatory domain-containing protein [Candidatus Acidiferrales bacterium]
MKCKLLPAVVATFAMVWAGATHAQAPKKSGGTLAGIVLGQNGKAVEHAAVVCQSSGGISPRVVYTDVHGRFTISGLRQDNYDVRASANGFYSDWEKNVVVRNGQTREVTVKLVNKDATP